MFIKFIEEAVLLVLLVMILSRYESVSAAASFQFSFMPHSSTCLCTAAIKNVIARYLHNGSPVLR